MKKYFMVYLASLFFGGALLLGINLAIAHASEKLIWGYQSCMTLDDTREFLNKLPEERALEAKIIVINSQRSFLGVLSCPYQVYYRYNSK